MFIDKNIPKKVNAIIVSNNSLRIIEIIPITKKTISLKKYFELIDLITCAFQCFRKSIN